MSIRMKALLARSLAELRFEPTERRVRALSGADTILDSRRALLVWEPRRVVPSYAVAAEDIRAAVEPVPAAPGEAGGMLHPGIAFAVHTAAGEPVSIGGGPGGRLPLGGGRGGGRVGL